MDILHILEDYCSKNELDLIKFNAQEVVYSEGEKAKGVYFLKEGQVKVFKYDRERKPIFLWTARPGEPIGLVSFFQNTSLYCCTVKANHTEPSLYFLPNKVFLDLLNQHPELKLKLLKRLCEGISFMEMRSKYFLFNSIDERIIETLIFLANREGEKKLNLRFEFSMKDFTEMVGASLGYIRKRVKNLKNKELIDYGRNWLVINDLEKLKLARNNF